MTRPRVTIRLRFALVAAVLFLLSGLALVTVNYVLVRNSIRPTITRAAVDVPPPAAGGTSVTAADDPRVIADDQARSLSERVTAATLRTLVSRSAIALAIATVCCFVLGWLVAGRFLRPVRRVTETARQLSEQTLHRRIELDGPDDELKELADTFDRMLERLDGSFDAHRRFIANASHELRTPLAIARTAVDVLERKRDPTPDHVARAVAKVRDATARSERLIDGLLFLARGQAGLAAPEVVDLGDVVDDVAEHTAAGARAGEIALRVRTTPAPVHGDRVLLERLVGNLAENALKYNVGGGWAEIVVWHDHGQPALRVSNTGAVIAPDAVAGLLEPFRRGGQTRTEGADGAGLGLSIVAAIAAAHGATLDVAARPGGGLDVSVRFPSV